MSASRPMKRSGFSQGIYEISKTKKEQIGIIRPIRNAKLRYAKAGTNNLSAGKLGVAAAINANHLNQAILATVAVGIKNLTVTVTAGTAIAENALAGGFLQINAGTGLGHQYEIESNSAIDASGTDVCLNLLDGIKVALDTTSKFTLVHSPFYGVVESATLGKPVGVPLVAVTANYYYWALTGGPGIGLIDGTPADGSTLQQSDNVAGAFEIYATGTITYNPIAHIMATGVDAEYKPIWLMID